MLFIKFRSSLNLESSNLFFTRDIEITLEVNDEEFNQRSLSFFVIDKTIFFFITELYNGFFRLLKFVMATTES